MKTHSLKWSNSPWETEPKKKKGKVLPSDNSSPNRTDYPRETEPGEKKGKVLPSDNNSPNRTDYPGETEPGEKKGKVLPSDNYNPNRIDYPRETEPGEIKDALGSIDPRRKRPLTANCWVDLDSSAQAIGNFVKVKSWHLFWREIIVKSLTHLHT